VEVCSESRGDSLANRRNPETSMPGEFESLAHHCASTQQPANKQKRPGKTGAFQFNGVENN